MADADSVINMFELIRHYFGAGLDHLYTTKLRLKSDIDKQRLREYTLQFLYAHPEFAKQIWGNKRKFIEAIPDKIKSDATYATMLDGVIQALKIFRKEQKK